MTENILIGLASIVILGILAQWLAWRLHLPAILLLLIFGFVAGPVAGILKPHEVFGQLLFPLISISVAIILFEGGLSLRFREIKRSRSIVFNLTTFGILVTWILCSLSAYYIIGVEFKMAILLGAILVVSGPTVIIPLLRQIRPSRPIGSIIKWEGIINDPMGAILAVVIFEIISTGNFDHGLGIVISSVLKAFFGGGIIGLLGAGCLILLLKRYLVPDFLQNAVALMLVVICYMSADAIQHESGLLAVTVMGVALANQKYVSIKQILEFKENLRVLIISSLFIILSATLAIEQLSVVNFRIGLFVISTIIIIRPLMVFLSTIKSKLDWRERLFLSWMAPRGIVAAAVASIFAIRLEEQNLLEGEQLVALTFFVIIGTVAIYGITAPYMARLLKIARSNPQGILIVGAHNWARQIASVLMDEGFKVKLVDSNWDHVTQARISGIEAVYGNILSEELSSDMPLDDIGRILALTPNDEVNSLALLHFRDIFGQKEIYQPVPRTSGTSRIEIAIPKHLQGRYLFREQATFDYLDKLFAAGFSIKKTPITEEFDFDDYLSMNSEAIPIFISTESKTLTVWTVDNPPEPKPGDTLFSIINENTIDPVRDKKS